MWHILIIRFRIRIFKHSFQSLRGIKPNFPLSDKVIQDMISMLDYPIPGLIPKAFWVQNPANLFLLSTISKGSLVSIASSEAVSVGWSLT